MSALGAPLAPHDEARVQRERRALWIVVGVGVAIALATASVRLQANPLLGAMVVGLVIVAFQRYLLAWRTLFGVILLIILFVPIRRYTVSGNLPFELEPYRIAIALVLAFWLCALAADPDVRWRRTGTRGADRRAADCDAALDDAQRRARQRRQRDRRSSSSRSSSATSCWSTSSSAWSAPGGMWTA